MIKFIWKYDNSSYFFLVLYEQANKTLLMTSLMASNWPSEHKFCSTRQGLHLFALPKKANPKGANTWEFVAVCLEGKKKILLQFPINWFRSVYNLLYNLWSMETFFAPSPTLSAFTVYYFVLPLSSKSMTA